MMTKRKNYLSVKKNHYREISFNKYQRDTIIRVWSLRRNISNDDQQVGPPPTENTVYTLLERSIDRNCQLLLIIQDIAVIQVH